MPWKPRKWLAVLLAFMTPILGMLYVNRPRWVGVYLLAIVPLVAVQYWLESGGREIPLAILPGIVAAVHAWRVATQAELVDRQPWFARWYGLLGVFLALAVPITLFRGFAYEPFRAPAGSMYPTVPKGSYLIAQKWGYGNYASYGIRLWRSPISGQLTRGQIFVFEYPPDHRINYFKRLVGLPGDHLVYKNKRLSVNGTELAYASDGYLSDLELVREDGHQIAVEAARDASNFDLTVPPGQLFFMGDNRDKSYDSRFWGTVSFDHVVGRVVLILNDGRLFTPSP